MKNNRGSLTIIAIFTVLIFSLYGVLLYARSASAYIRQSKSIETIQRAYAQDVPNAAKIAEQLGATSTYVGEYYTVTINADNGSEITSFSIMPGELVPKPVIPEKEGKGFDNWYYINASGIEEVFDFNVAPTSDVNIYAKYTGEAIMTVRSDVSFWKDEYREKITSIRFIKDEIPTNIEMLDDVQISGAARICAYVEDDGGGGYALTVVSPNTIYANTSANSYFSGFTRMESITFNNFDTSKVTNIGNMFYNCKQLKSLDVSSFNTSGVTVMASMFYDCNKLTSLNVSGFDTSKVTNMNYMFYNCKLVTSINVSGFDTSKVTTMLGIFQSCSGLLTLDVSSFNTSSVTNMGSMFNGCGKLSAIDVRNFNTSKVTNMNYMFGGCSAVTALDVSNFTTSKVTNMQYMFHGCRNVTRLDLSNFDTSKVKYMVYMFGHCEALSSLDLSSFDTSAVESINSMFYGCNNITTIYVGTKWNTERVTDNGLHMFNGCLKLVGEQGLTYSNYRTDVTYAHVDGGVDNPGYFTSK